MPDGAGPEDPMFGYIERFTAVMVAAGMPPMPSRVFVALMVTDSGRLTAASQNELGLRHQRDELAPVQLEIDVVDVDR